MAGLGTRFLPATKVVAKEMLPVLDRPLIQYAVDEAVDAGADTLIFVTNRYKHAIADYFDKAYELESKLAQAGKEELLALVQGTLPRNVRCVFVTQPEALGLGHAVLCAKQVAGDEPFGVILADDLIVNGAPGSGKAGALRQMAEVAAREDAGVLAVEEVPRADTRKYGIVDAESISARSARIRMVVEKPAPEVAPSRLGVAGRYILTPRIFQEIRNQPTGVGGEIQLTDAISRLLAHEAVYAFQYEGKRYDCGSKEGFLEATVEFALRHPEVGARFGAYLKRLVSDGAARG